MVIANKTRLKGIDLCSKFYNQVVKDIVTPIAPDHAACLVGHGSEVLGFDTLMSEDHEWHARCFIFIDGHENNTDLIESVNSALDKKLPSTFDNYDTEVVVRSARALYKRELGFDVYDMTEIDWLNTTSQIFRELTTGAVFKESKELSFLRDKLSFYPHDIWLYILSVQWKRIWQEMAFMGRCGDLGDDIGSTLVCSRLFSYIMRLCFLYERQYAPYWKWFGTAFSKLQCSSRLTPIIESGLRANNWLDRQKYLSQAYIILGDIHNEARLTASIEPIISNHYGRPFMVPDALKYEAVLLAEITDETVKNLPKGIGNVDQISDNTNFLGRHQTRQSVKSVWDVVN